MQLGLGRLLLTQSGLLLLYTESPENPSKTSFNRLNDKGAKPSSLHHCSQGLNTNFAE